MGALCGDDDSMRMANAWPVVLLMLRPLSGTGVLADVPTEQECLEQDLDNVLDALQELTLYEKGSAADETMRTLMVSSDLQGYCQTLRTALELSAEDPTLFEEAVQSIVDSDLIASGSSAEDGGPNGAGQCSEDESWWNYFNPWVSNEKHAKVNRIVHGGATVAAGLSAALAQMPGTSRGPITAIQVIMVSQIAETYGCKVSRAAVLGFIIKKAASQIGVHATTEVMGLVPGAGNAIKASIAFGMTESIGFAAKKLLKCSDKDNFSKDAELGQHSDVYKALEKWIDSSNLECATASVAKVDFRGALACFKQAGVAFTEKSSTMHADL